MASWCLPLGPGDLRAQHDAAGLPGPGSINMCSEKRALTFGCLWGAGAAFGAHLEAGRKKTMCVFFVC